MMMSMILASSHLYPLMMSLKERTSKAPGRGLEGETGEKYQSDNRGKLVNDHIRESIFIVILYFFSIIKHSLTNLHCIQISIKSHST